MSSPRRSRRWLRAGAAAGTAAFVAFAALPADAGPGGVDSRNNTTSKKLRSAVTAEGVLEHARVLQEIGEANGGTRVSGASGYDASVAYAMEVFGDAGYSVTKQDFTFQTFIEESPSRLRQVAPEPAADIPTRVMSYSGSGDVQAPVTALTTLGCAPADFAGFPAGNIALVQRGVCPFADKATNAHNAGASGVVIYNNVAGDLNGTLSDSFTLDIPVLSVTQEVGQRLAATPGLVLHVFADTFRGQATTSNVLAESRSGDPDNVVMAGAHLDSVNAGPGINDNGSGSATILEVAEQMAKVKSTNKVRFALWGAEESGLVGAHYYVNDLKTPAKRAELDKIALYLNFDMIGSPNYSRFVYDGDNSAFPVGPGAAPGPAGSGQIEDMFHDYFESVGLASAETPFSGRSDYGPFIAAGVDIPSGGLFTGAEGTKTAEQAAAFGGLTGVAYDPCYHQACDALVQDFGADMAKAAIYEDLNEVYDLVGNVNVAAVEEMADAVAHAVLTYAFDTSTVTGIGSGRPVSPPGRAIDGTPGGQMDDAGGGLHADHDHEEDVM